MSAAGRSFAGQAAVALLALSVLLGSCARSGGGNSAPRKNPLDGAVGATLPVAPQILVDQFGYRPGDDKVAVIRNPQVGFDADQKFSPGAAYEVRRAADGTTVFTGTLQAWNAGAVEESSGDDGWWFDFSSVKVPDRYFIYDTQRKLRSPTFSIGDDVYKKVLAAALRVFYYQRNGMAKTAPHAEPCWTDAAAYLG
ncbi:MAG: cellulase N-terminal Ig-like domain-containing protein, partial [Steroidobacteraceae bacterium]